MSIEIVDFLNKHVVDKYIIVHNIESEIHRHDYSYVRQFLVIWCFLYTASITMYFISSCLIHYRYFVDVGREDMQLRSKLKEVQLRDPQYRGQMFSSTLNRAQWTEEPSQITNEVITSIWSLFVMSGAVAVFELLNISGFTLIYYNLTDYGLQYLSVSVVLFFVFTDFLIYWIHRALHNKRLYRFHKLHHTYKRTTCFSAFAFHPIDGILQECPYHFFLFFFPMHYYLHTALMLLVGLWTIYIHSRTDTDGIPVINGASHHTVHHELFLYNYGQYFCLCDKMFGTYRSPKTVWPYSGN
jgi:lathosterol oxidase